MNSSVDIGAELPRQICEVRRALQALGRSGSGSLPAHLAGLSRELEMLATQAGEGGRMLMVQICAATVALCSELERNPSKVNASTLRSLAQAIDTLALLADHADWAAEPLHEARILVVDDDPVSRQTVCAALKRANLSATALEDPIAAVRLLETQRFDLIFLDVEMPGLDGFEVCQRVHATRLNARTPVVFVTALNGFETRARSNLSGGIDFIAKPVSMAELGAKALTHLARNWDVALKR